IHLDLIYSTILGCDLGPNLTHLGSLATLIWLFFLRRKGLDVSTWDYFRIGVLVTPIMLLGAILGLLPYSLPARRSSAWASPRSASARSGCGGSQMGSCGAPPRRTARTWSWCEDAPVSPGLTQWERLHAF